MREGTSTRVAGYELDLARRYDAETNLWVDDEGRVGFDPLGCETAGDIVSLSLAAVGGRVERGEPFGSLEAAKFVGPLVAPISGTVVARNDAPLTDPSTIAAAPLHAWLIQLDPSDPAELEQLIAGDAVAPWFAAAVERFRSMGVIAE